MNNEAIKIDDFLSGSMSETDLESFLVEMETSPTLNSEISLHQEINSAISDLNAFKLKDSLNQIFEENSSSPKVISLFSKNKLFSVAATIAVLCIVGGSIFWNSFNSSNTLYQQYFDSTTAYLQVRSENNFSTSDSNVLAGFKLMEAKEFNQAIEVFQKSPNNLMGQLYQGISYMEINKSEKAAIAFQKIISDNDNLFLDQAEWFLALTYIKMGKKSKAVKQLKTLSLNRGPYQNKAIELISKLR
ncbi:MAG: tol-pal system YbgF family protein [Bacteroidales bacterium]